ncbi:MAG: HAD family hydrolase [Candidatus Lokiarchaeota archaeon]|nr:HAD family hydrolase [Candidatus Lokiarchaeota archaeon]
MIHTREFLAIFDVDGTMVNLSGAIDFDALLVDAFKELGTDVPPVAERDALWRAGKNHADLLRSWGVASPRAFWDAFDRLDFEARSGAIKAGRIGLFPDCIPALSALHDSGRVVLAVHTNTPYKLARYQLEHFNIARYFEALLALDVDGYDQSRAKPEPWGIHHLQAKIGSAYGADFTGRTAFIGDSRIDMDAARNARIPGILVSRDTSIGDAKGGFDVVSSLVQATPRFLGSVIRRFGTGL